MQFVRQLLFICAAVGALATMPTAAAADAPKLAMVKKEAPKDIVLKGDAKCTTCHDEADSPELLSVGKTKHGTRADGRTPTCVDCHGESEKHTNHKGSDKPPKVDKSFRKNTSTPAEARNETCMTCHQKDSKRSHWAGSTHQTQDVACNSCHQVHAKQDKVRNKVTQAEVCFTCHKEQRAQYQRPSRHPILEGKVACSDCHNVHGSIGPKLVKRDSVNETCYTCHMEKRGPFARPHEPVTEDCGICHNPHGTTAENLLKQRPPFLCNECHSPHSAAMPQLAGQAATPSPVAKNGINYTQGRGCVNCHTQIHGTNNPARQDHNAGPGLRLPTPQYLLR